MENEATPETHKFALRLPKPLFSAIESYAKGTNSSINRTMVQLMVYALCELWHTQDMKPDPRQGRFYDDAVYDFDKTLKRKEDDEIEALFKRFFDMILDIDEWIA